MSTSLPSLTVTHPTRAENGYGARGPKSREEIEASTPTGRALHFLEGLAFTGSAAAARYRGDRDQRLTHDEQADLSVDAIAEAAMLLLARTDLDADHRALLGLILTSVQRYRLHDALEDAAASEGDGRVVTMHHAFRRIAAFVERSFASIRLGVNV